jgi:fumarate hydratase subunit alpha
VKIIDEKKLFNVALELIKRSCTEIASDGMELLEKAYAKERNTAARSMLETMIRNAKLATAENKPVCQSPGYPVVYATLGGDVKLEVGVQTVFQKALVEATKAGYLRPSMVHPITRKNPGDNSGIGVPDVEIEYDHEADYADFILSFKGCGAELPNVLKVLTPAQVGRNGVGIKKLVLESVVEAGGIPCPPVAIGIGIGGQIHYAAKLSRKAVSVRKWTDTNPNKELATMETQLLESINSLGIGPAGVGGDTTALAVKVEMVSTHTAICPVAMNFHCWTLRRRGVRVYSDGSVEYLFENNN